MMRFLFGLTRDLARMPMPWPLWVMVLVGANLIAPLFFWGHLEAQVTFFVFLAGALLMQALHFRLGFVRLLGLGHIFWFALVPWLALRGTEMGLGPDTAFGLWLWTTVVVNGLSLILDAIDVGKYMAGDRAPTL
jgi:hypothetical protein